MIRRRITAPLAALTLAVLLAGLAGGCGAKQDGPAPANDPAQAAAQSKKMGEQAAASAAFQAQQAQQQHK